MFVNMMYQEEKKLHIFFIYTTDVYIKKILVERSVIQERR